MGLSFPIASAQPLPNEVYEMDRSVNSQVEYDPTEHKSDFEQGLIQKRQEERSDDETNQNPDLSQKKQDKLDNVGEQDLDQTSQMKQKTNQSTEGENLQQNREDGKKASFTLRKDALSEKKASRFTPQGEKSSKVVKPLPEQNKAESEESAAVENLLLETEQSTILEQNGLNNEQNLQSNVSLTNSNQLESNESEDQSNVKTKTLSANNRELTITVDDQRTLKSESKNSNRDDSQRKGSSESSESQLSPAFGSKEAVEKITHESTSTHQQLQRESGENSTSNEINFRPVGETFSAEGGGGKVEVPVSREAANSFASYMKTSGKSDIVRNIQFVLKDNNTGQIKLILKPESLGSVRIQLSLTENNISGKIFVDNSSVRDIIQQNLNELAKSLEESGFENAALDVFVSGEQLSNDQQGAESEDDEPQVASQTQLQKLDNSVPSVYEGEISTQIDLVV